MSRVFASIFCFLVVCVISVGCGNKAPGPGKAGQAPKKSKSWSWSFYGSDNMAPAELQYLENLKSVANKIKEDNKSLDNDLTADRVYDLSKSIRLVILESAMIDRYEGICSVYEMFRTCADNFEIVAHFAALEKHYESCGESVKANLCELRRDEAREAIDRIIKMIDRRCHLLATNGFPTD